MAPTSADGGDAADIPFGPVATSRIKDPADGPNSWHICRDFIDPLAAELEEWLRNPESTPDDLKWFDVGLKRLGPDAYINAWDRARTFLMRHKLTEIRQSLEDAIHDVATNATRYAGKSDEPPLDAEGAERLRVATLAFSVQVVEPCLTHLRNLSHELKQDFPPPKPEQDEEEGGAGSEGGLVTLERNTPQLDRMSGKWVSNKRAADIEGLQTRTLADYRHQGIKDAAEHLGGDKDGRVWRREGTPRSHPWYLRSTLLAK